uniref:RING-type E3 ubiquitin transferase n=1 Tax=Fagus sylvatica TaxID=28930 RepID=A0A2N9GFX7_FAGSY
MIHKPNGSGRRTLTYPAVHPCEAISPATLLNSLINLAQSISDFKPEFFVINNRNARQSVRQIGILQIFLSELRNAHPDLPESVLLGLSELHLTFQKLQYLLEDCTREGSRLWMLMNSERVATLFRVLTRSISTALDVVPFDTIGVSIEVKEYVELVLKQARKARFEVEPADKSTMNDVISVLNRFENGIVPDKSILKRVLGYLGIKTWSECNKEVKFLDSEIALECTNDEMRKLGFLTSLMSFMSYCRCVVFDVVDGNNEATRQSNSRTTFSDLLNCVNSDDFRCPISMEFMIDPVTLSTGQTYDRVSIMKWFKVKKTCPKTGQKVANTELVPNLVLRRLIHQYCSENGIPVAGVSVPGSRNRDVAAAAARTVVAERAMRMVASYLVGKVEVGTEEEKNRAAYEVRVLSKTSGFNRACLVESGMIPHLLRVLLLKNVSVQENAIAALLNLSKHLKSRGVIVECGGVELVVDVVNKGVNLQAREHGAGVLIYLALIEEYRRLIGENPEAIPGLIELIKEGNYYGKKTALLAIFGLLLHPENHCKVIAAGAVPVLVNLIKYCYREDIVTDSLAILATLAEKADGTVAIMPRGALHLIMEIFNSSTSNAGKEYCVSLLLALCINGGADVVAHLVKSPSLMGSLYSLLSEGTSRASNKASTLIRVLHDFYESRPSGSISPIL